MAIYRKKPISIEAEQFPYVFNGTEESFAGFPILLDLKGPHILIPTLEGDMRADPGDWVITGVTGEKYPCKPNVFNLSYERVE